MENDAKESLNSYEELINKNDVKTNERVREITIERVETLNSYSFLKNFCNIETLVIKNVDLRFTESQFFISKNFMTLKRLSKLILDDSKVGCLKILRSINTLTYLSLVNCKVTSIDPIKNNKALTYLDISGNTPKDKKLDVLFTNFPGLKTLKAIGCGIELKDIYYALPETIMTIIMDESGDNIRP